MAGKGPQLRKGANLAAYWNNYDSIFKRKPIVVDGYCDHACPFFEVIKMDKGVRCSYVNKNLEYYDGFLASCEEEVNTENDQ